MKQKKDVPNIIRIEVPHDPTVIEGLLLFRYNHIAEQGYAFSNRDFDLLNAILLRQHGISNAPQYVIKYSVKDGEIIDRIKFEMISLAIQQGEDISEEDAEFYFAMLSIRAKERKKIVQKEIGRVVNNAKSLTLKNSQYYRELLNIVTKFSDLTLIDWFVPIKLTFERFVHIYVKHVEETKFGNKEFKKRSYFDYKHTEILNLLKAILRQEEEDIKEHFIYVPVGRKLNDKSLDKSYHRGFGKFPNLIFDGNEFRLSIDNNGFIQTFYQNK